MSPATRGGEMRRKKVKGGIRSGCIEEFQRLPRKGGPGCAMGDAVEAPGLDENAHVLEMNMALGSKEKIIEAGEVPVPGSFLDDKRHPLL